MMKAEWETRKEQKDLHAARGGKKPVELQKKKAVYDFNE